MRTSEIKTPFHETKQNIFNQDFSPKIWFQLSPDSIKQCNEWKMNPNEAIKLLAKPFRSCLVNMLINWSLNAETKATNCFTISSSDGDCCSWTLLFVYSLKSHFLSEAIKLSNMTTVWNKVAPCTHFFRPPSGNFLTRPSKLKHQTGTCWLDNL